MTNKRAATCMAAETLAVFLLFVSSGDAVSSGFVVSDFSVFDPLPDTHYLQDPTYRELKKRIVSALKTLSIQGKQSCLVQYWAATNAGKTHLLATTDQPFGIYGNDEGLELYRKACLHHKLYVHREGKTSFGLPGHAFEDRTPHQTQNMHYYPKDQRPPCEDKAIFSKKWGSFAVPVMLDNECIGVLEFVDTEPTHTYDGDINEVNNALKCAGFEPFNMRDTIKDTHISNKRQRKTNSSIYGHYNVLVPYFGWNKTIAMDKISSKFFPKKQTETTPEATHIPDYSAGKVKKEGKKVKEEFKVIKTTFRNTLRDVVGITEWPYIRETTSKASCAPKMRINPMASAASSFRSLNADDLTFCFVQGEASEGSLKRSSITNTSTQTQNDQIISCSTSYTEALCGSEYARPNFLPDDKRVQFQDHRTTNLDALNHFVVDNDYTFPGQEIPDSSESRTDETLCGKTSSIEIPNNAGDLNSSWDIDFDHYLNVENDLLFLDQEIHDSSDTRTDQTLCDGTNSFGIRNDASCDFTSRWDKGLNERPVELITTTSTSASGVHQSSTAGLEQSCETGDVLFFRDLFEQDFLMQEELAHGFSFSPTK